ncbi:MAG: PAS domain-containing protein [Promethearchaeota archaeon]|nr:MAG: PAS domain-containing protein [Candidatus Lokiarchaeota archaeon]
MGVIKKNFDSADVLILLLDENMKILYLNPYGLNLLNRESEEVIGQNYFDLCLPDRLRIRMKNIFQNLVSNDQPELELYENPILTKNNEERLLTWRNTTLRDNENNFISVLSIGYLKTQKNHKGLFFLENVRDKTLILDNIQEHIIFQDVNHKIIWANKAAADSLNLKSEELIGKKCYCLWAEREEVCEGCPVEESLEKNKPVSHQMSTPDGRYWLVKGVTVKDDADHIVGAVETTLDITTEKIARHNLESSEKRYREAYNRAEFYKDLFAHDINNILQNIKSANEFIQLLKDSDEFYEKMDSITQTISQQIDRGAKLVNNIRKLSQLEEKELWLNEIDILPYLNEAILSIKEIFHNKKITIKTDISTERVVILANEFIIDIFENILINAVKHNKNEKVEVLINIKKDALSNNIRLEFIDNAIGIRDEKKDQIFKKQYIKKNSGTGLGLGLSLVKKIIDIYDGRIWVENKDPKNFKKGSKFIVLLPGVKKSN